MELKRDACFTPVRERHGCKDFLVTFNSWWIDIVCLGVTDYLGVTLEILFGISLDDLIYLLLRSSCYFSLDLFMNSYCLYLNCCFYFVIGVFKSVFGDCTITSYSDSDSWVVLLSPLAYYIFIIWLKFFYMKSLLSITLSYSLWNSTFIIFFSYGFSSHT